MSRWVELTPSTSNKPSRHRNHESLDEVWKDINWDSWLRWEQSFGQGWVNDIHTLTQMRLKKSCKYKHINGSLECEDQISSQSINKPIYDKINIWWIHPSTVTDDILTNILDIISISLVEKEKLVIEQFLKMFSALSWK